MPEIDWNALFPVHVGGTASEDPWWDEQHVAEHQRSDDIERIMPLVKALEQIIDWNHLPGDKYAEKWGQTPRYDFTPSELAYAALSDLGVQLGQGKKT